MFALKVGVPSDWGITVEEIEKAADELERELRQKLKKHRRGLYRTVATGFSYGNGQTVRLYAMADLAPTNLCPDC